MAGVHSKIWILALGLGHLFCLFLCAVRELVRVRVLRYRWPVAGAGKQTCGGRRRRKQAGGQLVAFCRFLVAKAELPSP